MTKKLKTFNLVVGTFLLSTATFFAFHSMNKVEAKADAPATMLFQMEKGASVRLEDDGIRFRVKMDKAAYDYIVTNDTTNAVSLSVWIAPKTYFNAVGTDYANLASKAEFSFADETKLYKSGQYYYANAVMTNLADRGYQARDFAAVGFITDTALTAPIYTTFEEDSIDNSTRNQYYVLNRALLDENADYETELLETENPYSWYGTEEYPVQTETDAELEKLGSIIENNADFDKKIDVSGFNNILKADSVQTSNGTATPSGDISVINVGHVNNSHIHNNVSFETDLPDAVLSYLASEYSLKVSFTVYHDSGDNPWDGNLFSVGGVTSSEGAVISSANTPKIMFSGSQTLERDLYIDVVEYCNAIQGVRNNMISDTAYSFVVSRLTTQQSAFALKINSVELAEADVYTDSLLGTNVLDVNSVEMKAGWGDTITPTVESGVVVANVPHVNYDVTWGVGPDLAVSFKTTLSDSVLQSLIAKGYSLRVSFIAYYDSGNNPWNGNPFYVAGVNSSNGDILSYEDGVTKTGYAGHQTNVQTVDIDVAEYYYACQAVDKNGGIGDNAYSFVVSRDSKAQASPYYLKITGVTIVEANAAQNAWELGTIYTDGVKNGDSTTRIRNTGGLIEISETFAAKINEGYKLKWFAWDEGYGYLGCASSWLENGFTYTDITSVQPDAKYIRVLFAKTSDGNMTLSDVEASGVVLLNNNTTE